MSAELASRSSVSTDVSYFKSTISQNITSGVATLSFDMKPYTRNGAPITKGEISVTLTLAAGQVLIKSFSRKSNEITLAEYEKNGFYFMAGMKMIHFRQLPQP